MPEPIESAGRKEEPPENIELAKQVALLNQNLTELNRALKELAYWIPKIVGRL